MKFELGDTVKGKYASQIYGKIVDYFAIDGKNPSYIVDCIDGDLYICCQHNLQKVKDGNH